jgi:two-component system nitrogen regulation response regulator NtrX
LPDGNGIDLLRLLREKDDRVPAIMISGHATIPDAVEALRAGAFDFLEKPLARDKVLIVVKNALEQAKLRVENERFREIVGDGPKMIGASSVFKHAVQQASLVAPSDARVLITGESGTGKELLAAHIHRESPFVTGPFVKVNCAAIPTELVESELFGYEKGAFTGAVARRRGKFELADGGTLFLDEVGDLHLASQAKLLRVLQEGEFERIGGEQPVRVEVRVISATNRDLQTMVSQDRFREDLYYRLSVVPIRMPPLRERRDDIPLLAVYFLDEFCTRNNFKRKTIDEDAMSMLQRYAWPGNARELKNAVERMAILSAAGQISSAAVPLEIRNSAEADPRSNLQQARESAERESILKALEQTNWNVAAAARVLAVERTSLHKRIRALGIQRLL